jgi:hypothetical protein
MKRRIAMQQKKEPDDEDFLRQDLSDASARGLQTIEPREPQFETTYKSSMDGATAEKAIKDDWKNQL